MLSKEDILGADDLPVEPLKIPEWSNGLIYHRMVAGVERDAFEASTVELRGSSNRTNLQNIRARWAVLVVCDEQGKRLFEDKDAAKLGAKCAAALDRIWDASRKLNRMGEDDVEELAKNSNNGETGSSPTASPRSSASPASAECLPSLAPQS